jgi:peptidoglycan hydrolase-like protein with peptidoglycan-binding domain
MLVEGQFGHGAVKETLNLPKYGGLRATGASFDWETGFDIRNVLEGEIFKKNQYTSSSCVGQGSSYYEWVLQVLELMKKYNFHLPQLRIDHADEVDEISAKAIYSQISLGPNEGARFSDAMYLVTTYGALFEKDVSSYKPDKTTDEMWMIDKSWGTPALAKKAKILLGKTPHELSVTNDINLFAEAILENYGVVGGVTGADGHGWASEISPTPPLLGEQTWGHCLFFGAAGTDEKGKFIATPNSWGNFLNLPSWYEGAPIGFGWQKLRENYFGSNLFNPWTYVDLPDDQPFQHTFLTNLFPGSNNPPKEVIALQTALFLQGCFHDADLNSLEQIAKFGGYYGGVTVAGVKEFQKKYGILVTGNCGRLTRQELNILYS